MDIYCVILCLEPLGQPHMLLRVKRLYLRAAAADEAVKTASDDNPPWRVIGVEPRDLFARLLRSDPSPPTPYNRHAS
jgi:hypothetical protein